MTGGGYSRVAAASTKAKFNNKPRGGASYAAAAAAVHADQNRGFFAAMAEALAASFSRGLLARARKRVPRRVTRYAPNGNREMDRRFRQMARGKIIDAMPVRPGWTPPRWLRRADTQHIRAGASLRAANFRR
jgi:hypothetical protein